MYENGKQKNRYANKLTHKQHQKNHYRRKWFGGLQATSWKDYVAHKKEFDELKYWKEYYLSGPKKFAKKRTNSIIRTRFRENCSSNKYENIYALQHSDYRKYFDFCWAIW